MNPLYWYRYRYLNDLSLSAGYGPISVLSGGFLYFLPRELNALYMSEAELRLQLCECCALT